MKKKMKAVNYSYSPCSPENMTRLEADLIAICNEGQKWSYVNRKYVNEYGGFIKKFAGRVKEDLKTKNPVVMSCIFHDINSVLEILNPALKKEMAWFNRLSEAVKNWVNDRITVHRMLGIKNDNQS